MTELYTRFTSTEPWHRSAWLHDADAERLAQALREEGYQVALVRVTEITTHEEAR